MCSNCTTTIQSVPPAPTEDNFFSHYASRRLLTADTCFIHFLYRFFRFCNQVADFKAWLSAGSWLSVNSQLTSGWKWQFWMTASVEPPVIHYIFKQTYTGMLKLLNSRYCKLVTSKLQSQCFIQTADKPRSRKHSECFLSSLKSKLVDHVIL